MCVPWLSRCRSVHKIASVGAFAGNIGSTPPFFPDCAGPTRRVGRMTCFTCAAAVCASSTTVLHQRRLLSNTTSEGGRDAEQPRGDAPSGSPGKRRMSLTIRSPGQRVPRHAGAGGLPSSEAAARRTYEGGLPEDTRSGPPPFLSPHGGSGDRSSPLHDEGGPVGTRGVEVKRNLSHFTEPVKRIILIRNGRSEANEDVSTYVSTPDWRIPLVEEGKRECVGIGRKLAELVGDEPVYIYYSPYIRSRQSLRYVLQGYDEGRQAEPNRHEWWEDDDEGPGGDRGDASAAHGGASSPSHASPHSAAQLEALDAKLNGSDACAPKTVQHPHARAALSTPTAAVASTAASAANMAPFMTSKKLHDTSLVLRSGSNNRIIGVREDVRLRDGDIGRYRNTQELIYHLEERERYGRFFYRFPFGESGADVCDRITSFLDAFQRERVEFPMDTNVVVITHGLTIRMLIKRWFHLTVDTFHKMHSPPSGSIVTLTRLHHRSCFRLDEGCVEGMNLPLSLNEHNGYKYRNKRLLGSMSSGAPYM